MAPGDKKKQEEVPVKKEAAVEPAQVASTVVKNAFDALVEKEVRYRLDSLLVVYCFDSRRMDPHVDVVCVLLVASLVSRQ